MTQSFLVLVSIACLWAVSVSAAHVFVEAESFEKRGGWKLDTQFIPIMGSPYLIAHGLGEPVADAATPVKFPDAGQYRVWVRTKDWVAHWKAPGTPGQFQVLIDGKPLLETFGARSAEWFWQDGGLVDIPQTQITLALHDLTGFDGRCDAILFSDEVDFIPPNDSASMAAWRRAFLGLPEQPTDAGEYDLVVVGGGYAGTCAALSAARLGCKVALIQDRPVLGGNGSAEIRVWPQGKTRRGLYPRLGEIVEELADRPSESPGPTHEFDDAHRESVVRQEKNLTLFLNHFVYELESSEDLIKAVIALDTRTGEIKRFRGVLFADCTGHGTIGVMAKADHTLMREGHLGMSNMWRWKLGTRLETFPEAPWALQLSMKDFPYPKDGMGKWFWESGFDLHPLHDLELIRDWNLRAVFGAFNAMKNGDGKEQHRRAKLEWVAYVGGNRESRQLLGDVVLSRDDIVAKKQFPDGCVPSTWSIDLHYPDQKYTNAYPENPFISKAVFDHSVDSVNGYPVPYRCFYSRNVENLFMAGRCISVTHEALGTVRVMKTGGMMGEVVGKAASICAKYGRLPRMVYHSHWDELQQLMRQPGVARRNTVNDPIYIPEGAVVLPDPELISINANTLEGIVVDDSQAKITGRWSSSQNLRPHVGQHYLYRSPGEGAAVRYEFNVGKSGPHEVRLACQPHANRATNTRVTVNTADGPQVLTVNQREVKLVDQAWVSLGRFSFKAGQASSVVIESAGANGTVHADAVQILPASD